MALTATIYNFDVELADNDRSVYESLALRMAHHASESDEYPASIAQASSTTTISPAGSSGCRFSVRSPEIPAAP